MRLAIAFNVIFQDAQCVTIKETIVWSVKIQQQVLKMEYAYVNQNIILIKRDFVIIALIMGAIIVNKMSPVFV